MSGNSQNIPNAGGIEGLPILFTLTEIAFNIVIEDLFEFCLTQCGGDHHAAQALFNTHLQEYEAYMRYRSNFDSQGGSSLI